MVYHPVGDCIPICSNRFKLWRHNAKATEAVRAELALEEDSWKVPAVTAVDFLQDLDQTWLVFWNMNGYERIIFPYFPIGNVVIPMDEL